MRFLLTLSLLACSVIAQSQAPVVDAGFGRNGEAIINNGNCSALAHTVGNTRRLMTTLADGKMLLGFRYDLVIPSSGATAMGIMKVSPGGTIDSSFGVNGIAAFTPGDNCSLKTLQALPDGKILASGTAVLVGATVYSYMFRLLPNGRPDSSFGKYGFFRMPGTIGSIELYQVLVQPDGNYLALGISYPTIGPNRLTVTRVLKEGQLDMNFGTGSFGSQGYYISATLPPAIPVEGVIHSNNFITVVTSFADAGSNYHYLLLRLNPSGRPDSSFGTNGFVQFTGTGYSSYSLKVLAAANDKIIVLGSNQNFGDSSFVNRFLYNGSADSSFGINGRFLLQKGPNYYTSDMAMLADSTLVLMGSNDGEYGRPRFLQGVTASGTTATSFGVNGSYLIDSTADSQQFLLFNPVSNKLYSFGTLAISPYTPRPLVLKRFNTSGITDSSFASQGTELIFDGGSNDHVTAVARQSDGKIVLAGTTIGCSYISPQDGTVGASLNWFIRRLLPNGNTDSSFGSNGTRVYGDSVPAHFTPTLYPPNALNALIVLPNNDFLVGGSSTSNGNIYIRKYSADGTPDPSFASGGIFKNAFSGNAFLTKMLLQPDGKIVLAGYSDSIGGYHRILLARLTAQGSIDASFSQKNLPQVPFPGYEMVRTMALRADGKIIVAAAASVTNAPARIRLMQLNKDGSTDSTFGINGNVYRSSNVADLFSSDLLIQPDGKIVLLYKTANNPYYDNYSTNYGLSVGRFQTNGQPDSSFGIQGYADYGAYNFNQTAPYQLWRQDDGRLLIAGIGNESTYIPRLLLARLRANGSFDTTFAQGGSYLLNNWYAQDTYDTYSTDLFNSSPSFICRVDSVSYLAGGNIKHSVTDGWLTKLIIKDSLPAKSISLTDTLRNGNCASVQLFWTATNETGSQKFIVERSADSAGFSSIASVTASLNTSAPKQYTYTDNARLPGKSFYRVRLYGTVGSELLSNTIVRTADTTLPGVFQHTTLSSSNSSGAYQEKLNWDITHQYQADSILIAKRTNHGAMVSIASITPQAPDVVNSYSYTDNAVTAGNSYTYIITLVGANCRRVVSDSLNNTITGIFDLPGYDGRVSLYPNPVHSAITIQLPPDFARGSLSIYSSDGKTVYTKNNILFTGGTLSVNLESLPPGSYFMKLTGPKKTWTGTFSKQ